MRELWSVADVIKSIPRPRSIDGGCPLSAPYYNPYKTNNPKQHRVGLAVSTMKDHTTDEGWQIFQGLEHSGYLLFGNGIQCQFQTTPMHSMVAVGWTDCKMITNWTNPITLVMQDKREWDTRPGDFRDPDAIFHNVDYLKGREDIFKLTILKDAHQRPEYHRQSAEEIGCHAWIVYYNPHIVTHLAPYVRPQHLIRTYHTVNKGIVPRYCAPSDPCSGRKKGCVISGAISSAYPLRKRLVKEIGRLPDTKYLPHPGYHRNGCNTPAYLQVLSQFKVAVCTASIYGYSLRKIIEATACGCSVITDLPCDEVLPKIDGNLVRITPDTPTHLVGDLIKHMLETYNPLRQSQYARIACEYYDYREMGKRLASDIEWLRGNYNVT